MRSALSALLLATLLLAGCQGPPPEQATVSHVHGLAYDPTRDALFVATHHGLVRGEPTGASWSWTYAGPERYDYMGFTQDAVRPGVFYSSGHPDNAAAYGANNLGLRRSTDGGATWEQRSLKGQADFHALTSLPSGEGHIAGAWQTVVKHSTDGGLTWQDRPAPGPVYALAASEGILWAAVPHGLMRTADGFAWQPATGPAPGPVTSVAASRDGKTLLASTGDGSRGSVYRSLDGAATWQEAPEGPLKGAKSAVAFAIDPEDASHLFASTPGGTILESTDAGATWAVIRSP